MCLENTSNKATPATITIAASISSAGIMRSHPWANASIMVALAVITAAFVVITITFIGAMLYLNNPLEKVPDIEMPSSEEIKNMLALAELKNYGYIKMEILFLNQ